MTLLNDINRSAVLGDGWEANAARQWGVPLHPLGEFNAIDYMIQSPKDAEEVHERARGLNMQLFIGIVISYVFAYNFVATVRMTHRRPDAMVNWCCLLQALIGMGYAICLTLLYFPGGPSCRQAMWYCGVALPTSSLCISAALLQKAYIVHSRSKQLLVFGIVLLLPQPLVTYFFWISPIVMVPGIGCIIFHPPYFPWVKLALDAPINILFSGAFVLVVYEQYRRYGSAAWERLVRTGTQTMCAIALSNIICMTCVALEVLGMFSEFFFLVDWIVTSLLLTHHCTTI
ncbi:hypothetical protein THASP1DRAFT_31124 [Thamnocephalis sphaerospora]|uniref:Uncharacterized protein n=1 Tax=Thamnocephalis sphaerospora TaxID=78915 RepID=A0A4P9XMF2_9FUNG|nr:hypothetical protein THASP1DRAFT_31124 [Thamnocephalis sphaerospora]|eukprot:RKP07055.1 hypothetical protein THASP1DRAFT_31124 [Thamnocephalis sphaerospora]